MSLIHRMLSVVGFPRQTAPSEQGGPLGAAQLSHQTTGEIHDGMLIVQAFGFASVPEVGCDHVTIYGEGDRSKGVSIATNDQRFRPRGMLSGESQQYDSSGQFVYLQGSTKVAVNGKTEIDFQINGTLVGKFTSTGLAVTGNITATGNISWGVGGSDEGDGQGHKHNVENVQTGDSTIETTAPVAGT